MSSLDAIGVRVEGLDPPDLARQRTRPILHEIRHALDRLLGSGEETAIDLRGLPFAETDIAYLLTELGTGELACRLDALGRSVIRETAFPGVWVVEHHNVADNLMGRFIEVTYLPSILRSDPADVRSGLDRLIHRLEDDADAVAAAGADSP